jgi:molecular chaperone Hsp33
VDIDYSIRAAGGFLIQLLPGLSDEDISEIEAQLSGLRSVTAMLDEGMRPEDILKEILPDFTLLEESTVVHRCTCSKERVEQTLVSLGREELAAMIREDGQAEVSCHFCNERYHFAREELESLAANL